MVNDEDDTHKYLLRNLYLRFTLMVFLPRLARKRAETTVAKAARFSDSGYFQFSSRDAALDTLEIPRRTYGSRNPATLTSQPKNPRNSEEPNRYGTKRNVVNMATVRAAYLVILSVMKVRSC